LEQELQTYPAQEWVLITDNLSTHLWGGVLLSGPDELNAFLILRDARRQ
jgi:hypothetical protein